MPIQSDMPTTDNSREHGPCDHSVSSEGLVNMAAMTHDRTDTMSNSIKDDTVEKSGQSHGSCDRSVSSEGSDNIAAATHERRGILSGSIKDNSFEDSDQSSESGSSHGSSWGSFEGDDDIPYEPLEFKVCDNDSERSSIYEDDMEDISPSDISNTVLSNLQAEYDATQAAEITHTRAIPNTETSITHTSADKVRHKHDYNGRIEIASGATDTFAVPAEVEDDHFDPFEDGTYQQQMIPRLSQETKDRVKSAMLKYPPPPQAYNKSINEIVAATEKRAAELLDHASR